MYKPRSNYGFVVSRKPNYFNNIARTRSPMLLSLSLLILITLLLLYITKYDFVSNESRRHAKYDASHGFNILWPLGTDIHYGFDIFGCSDADIHYFLSHFSIIECIETGVHMSREICRSISWSLCHHYHSPNGIIYHMIWRGFIQDHSGFDHGYYHFHLGPDPFHVPDYIDQYWHVWNLNPLFEYWYDLKKSIYNLLYGYNWFIFVYSDRFSIYVVYVDPYRPQYDWLEHSIRRQFRYLRRDGCASMLGIHQIVIYFYFRVTCYYVCSTILRLYIPEYIYIGRTDEDEMLREYVAQKGMDYIGSKRHRNDDGQEIRVYILYKRNDADTFQEYVARTRPDYVDILYWKYPALIWFSRLSFSFVSSTTDFLCPDPYVWYVDVATVVDSYIYMLGLEILDILPDDTLFIREKITGGTGGIKFWLVCRLHDSFVGFSKIEILLATTFICFVAYICRWVYELHTESVYYGRHNKKVKMSLIVGSMLFLTSEAVLFAGSFRALFDRVFALPSHVASIDAVEHINCTGAPLFGTVVLLLSGYCANLTYLIGTWYDSPNARKTDRVSSIRVWNVTRKYKKTELDGSYRFGYQTVRAIGRMRVHGVGLYSWYYIRTLHCVTVLLGIVFLIIQIYEYQSLLAGISYNVYFSLFLVLTGFHGMHVVIGILLLTITDMVSDSPSARPKG